jgi:hypothetical protein
MNRKKFWCVLLVLFVVGAVFTFALSPEEYESIYKMGYLAGYTTCRGKNSQSANFSKTPVIATNELYGETTDANREKKGIYKNGYKAGWEDKRNENPNRYLTQAQ